MGHKRTCHLIFVHNLCHISHHIYNASLHYLVKNVIEKF